MDLETERSPAQFQVRAHAWVVGQSLAGGVQEAPNRTSMLLSLPSPLSKNTEIKIFKKQNKTVALESKSWSIVKGESKVIKCSI